MNTQNINLTNDPIHRHVDAVRNQEPEQHEVDRAQRRLVECLESRHPPGRGIARVLGWGMAAAAVLLVPMLLWMPGTTGGVAFAEVQRYFLGFETMTVRLATTIDGNEVMDMTIRVDDRNRARLDSGDGFSYVIDPQRAQMLLLFHDQQRASFVPLGAGRDAAAEAGLDWLDDIRQFQGEAESLDETIVIRGQEAYGFRLETGGMNMTLWAAESGEPLRLLLRPESAPAKTAVETRMDFEFDSALDEALFSLTPPANYVLDEGGPAD